MSDFVNNTSMAPAMSSIVGESLIDQFPFSQQNGVKVGFARQRWQNGILLTLQAGALIGAGAFLLHEIPATPGLKVQMAILSVILIAGGLWMIPKILVDFFGTIQIDQRGIHMGPSLVGFSTPWSDVEKWEIRDCHGVTAAHCVRVWPKNSTQTHTVPAGFLSHHDLHLLRRLMLAAGPAEIAGR